MPMTETPVAPATHALPSEATADRRLRALASLAILDTAPEPEFDDLVRLASSICAAPIALVSLLDEDRQWFKGRIGLDMQQTPLQQSFCAYAIGTPDQVTVVEDATVDERFRENPLVTEDPSIRAYAGMPFTDGHGVPLGTICVIDTEPRTFGEGQREALRVIAKQITTQLELRLRVRQLERMSRGLVASNEQLDRFAQIIAHDLLAPIRQQSVFSQMLTKELGSVLPERAREYVEHITRSGQRATDLITDIGTYVQAAQYGRSLTQDVRLGSVIDAAIAGTEWPAHIAVTTAGLLDVVIDVNRAAVYHILVNLLSNAAKFADLGRGRVAVSVSEDFDTVHVDVRDNGGGIGEQDLRSVFEIFRRGANAADKPGRGLGLSIARKLALNLCGELSVSRSLEGETVFRLELPRVDCYGIKR